MLAAGAGSLAQPVAGMGIPEALWHTTLRVCTPLHSALHWDQLPVTQPHGLHTRVPAGCGCAEQNAAATIPPVTAWQTTARVCTPLHSAPHWDQLPVTQRCVEQGAVCSSGCSGHASRQSSAPSPSESASGCPQPHTPGSVLAGSLGQVSCMMVDVATHMLFSQRFCAPQAVPGSTACAPPPLLKLTHWVGFPLTPQYNVPHAPKVACEAHATSGDMNG